MATEMNQTVRAVRWGLVLVALVIALVALLSQTGALQMPCNEYCARIRDWSVSPLISILAIVGLLLVGHSLKSNNERLFRLLALSGLGIALALQVLAISWQGVCALCMGLAFIILGLAITAVPRVAWSYAALLPGLFGLFVIFDEFAPNSAKEPERITYRPYESPPGEREHGYIVYIDPEDSASRLLIANTNESARPDIKVYYRWRLSSGTKEQSMRSIIAIEAVNSQKPELASTFRREMLTMSLPRTHENIIAVARKHGIEKIVVDAFESRHQFTRLVDADQKEYERHELNELPAVLAVLHDGTHRAHPASTELLVNMGDPNLMQKATSPPGGN
jgi:hypothetical protein